LLHYCPKQLAKGLYEFIPGHLVIPGTGITGACHMTLNGLGGGAVMAVPAMTKQPPIKSIMPTGQ
jgi:hypothetical protein